jgi:hypothetical protein
MNDDVRIKELFEALEKGLEVLRKSFAPLGGDAGAPVEIDLTLPEADIGGLRFNETKVHAAFEKKKIDGWYYSRDILFLSARNAEDDNSRDILTEYLNRPGDNGLKEQLAGHFDVHPQDIEISLPNGNAGIKRYNGVDWWYWLTDPSDASADRFCNVATGGFTTSYIASAVGGCAPAFRVGSL